MFTNKLLQIKMVALAKLEIVVKWTEENAENLPELNETEIWKKFNSRDGK